MEQLGIKHLGRRLAYGVKAINAFKQTVEVLGLQNGNESVGNELWVFKHPNGDYLQGYLYECKPILRDLSDLTKEITHKGEKFVPIERLSKLYPNVPNWNDFSAFWISTTSRLKNTIVEYCVVEWLLEHHFHIDEPEGTWIDVNNLPKNPYE